MTVWNRTKARGSCGAWPRGRLASPAEAASGPDGVAAQVAPVFDVLASKTPSGSGLPAADRAAFSTSTRFASAWQRAAA